VDALAAGTVHRVHVVLYRALTQALRWEWIWFNPASAASPPRAAPAEVRPPSPEQLNRLLAHVEQTDPDFATYCGWRLRPGPGAASCSGFAGRRSISVTPRSGSVAVTSKTRADLRATKTHRSYRVAIDTATIERLVEHRLSTSTPTRSPGVFATRRPGRGDARSAQASGDPPRPDPFSRYDIGGVEIYQSALKHGVDVDDIIHAVEQALVAADENVGKVLC
jgi:hypothetical protein